MALAAFGSAPKRSPAYAVSNQMFSVTFRRVGRVWTLLDADDKSGAWTTRFEPP
jgi:hypothetical protein